MSLINLISSLYKYQPEKKMHNKFIEKWIEEEELMLTNLIRWDGFKNVRNKIFGKCTRRFTENWMSYNTHLSDLQSGSLD